MGKDGRVTTAFDLGFDHADQPDRWGTGSARMVRLRVHAAHGARSHAHIHRDDEDLSQAPDAAVAAVIMTRLLSVERACASGEDGFPPLHPRLRPAAFELVRAVQPPTITLLPSVVPSHRGDLQLDWSLPTSLIEVQFTPDGDDNVLIETRDGDAIYDGPLDDDAIRWVRKELDAAVDISH